MADPIRDAALAAQPVAPSEDPSDFQTLHSVALDMVETLRPIVIPEILGVLRKAIEQSPAPTTHTPLDLDALLSPEGAYEPGTGTMDGAQLLTGRHGEQEQWWVPIVGCDTLNDLLDRIRSRILPHLRPPIAGIDVPGPDGDYGGLQELCEAEGVDVRIGAPLLKRARKAWNAAAQPPAPAPASDGEREALAAWLEREMPPHLPHPPPHLAPGAWRAGFRAAWALACETLAATLLRNPAPAAVPPAPTPASDGEREKRPQAEQIAEALARLYWWGGLSLEHGYNSDTVIGVRDWIRGGMLGDLPPLPTWIADRCPPLTSSAIPQPPHSAEMQP